MSDVNIDDLRRDYKFKLEPAKRCDNCRHAKPNDGPVHTHEGQCRLLNIQVANVHRSVCPGWQTSWGYDST